MSVIAILVFGALVTQSSANTNECSEGSHNCHGNATCANTAGSFNCTCNPGYTGNGTYCQDIDECTEGICHENAMCTNTAGLFYCYCHTGYTGNGNYCGEINECTEGSHNCHDNATCANTAGSFHCTCNPGYTGNGTYCRDIDECDDESDPSYDCHDNVTCTYTPESYTCVCKKGFGGDGYDCINIDECSTGFHNCHAHATCTDTIGSYTCACFAGFTGNGTYCEDTSDPGSSNPASSDNSVEAIIEIVVTVVVVILVIVMATAMVIVACLIYRRKRGKKNSRDIDIDNIQNTAYEGDTPRNVELPRIPDPESVYEEPAEYAQLASSLRDPVDANYQSLLNGQNYEQPDKDCVNENIQQNPSMSMDSNPSNEVPGETEYVIMP